MNGSHSLFRLFGRKKHRQARGAHHLARKGLRDGEPVVNAMYSAFQWPGDTALPGPVMLQRISRES